MNKVQITEVKGAWINLNRACNLRCRWCYARHTNFSDSQTMSKENALRIVDICMNYGIESFTLIGGEPTIYPHITEVLEYIVAKGGKAAVMSNGIELENEEFCRRIASISTERILINISLKGISDESYIRDCGSPSFSKLLKGVENCRKHNVKISFIYILSADNIQQLTSFAQKFVDYKLSDFQLSFAFCTDVLVDEALQRGFGRSVLDVNKSYECQYDEINRILDGKFAIHQTVPLCLCDKKKLELMKSRSQIMTSCHLMKRNGVIFDTNGGILFCNHLVGTTIGEIDKDYRDSESFKEFFESDTINEIRNQITTAPTEHCLTCPNADDCGGGCALRWFNTSYKELATSRIKQK